MRTQNLGWILAVGMGATLVAGGFRQQPIKVGIVDLQQVAQTSEYYQQREGDLKAMSDARTDLLKFVNSYQTITEQQATRLRALTLKTTLTPAEKAELNKLRADIQTAEQTFTALNQKPTLTEDDKSKLAAFNNQKQVTKNRTIPGWQQDFTVELNDQRTQYRQEVLDRVTGALADCGKKQSYTLVFANDVAPFGANDVTGETLKVMNAKK